MKKLLSLCNIITLIGSTAVAVPTVISKLETNTLKLTKTTSLNDTYDSEKWDIYASGPKNETDRRVQGWYLEFNHELVQDMILGASMDGLAEIIAKAISEIPELKGIVDGEDVPIIINGILIWGKEGLANADEGNGILIRLIIGIVPTSVTSSTHNWN